MFCFSLFKCTNCWFTKDDRLAVNTDSVNGMREKTAAPDCRYPLVSRGASGGPLPSNEEMGSKMPNCLRTAMKRMMTTPMANSSMPWMPMSARRGDTAAGEGLGPAQRCWATLVSGVFNRGELRRGRTRSGWRQAAWDSFQAHETAWEPDQRAGRRLL